jgi:hypothetical protein
MNKQQGPVEWRPVVGYEGLYEASSDGQVRSLARKTTTGKVLSPQINNSGYLRVSVTKNTSKYLYIHHLVAAAFIGPRPNGMDVNHINGIKTDNRAENLEYVTRTENMRHARQHGLHDNRGEKAWNACLTTDQVRTIKRALELCGESPKVLAEAFGVSVNTIRHIQLGNTWRHVDSHEEVIFL